MCTPVKSCRFLTTFSYSPFDPVIGKSSIHILAIRAINRNVSRHDRAGVIENYS